MSKVSISVAFISAVAVFSAPTQAKEPGNPGTLWSVDWSADGTRFAVGGEWSGVFDAKTFDRLPSPSFDGLKMATKVRWHPRRNLLASSGGADEDTAILDVETGRKISLKTAEGTRAIAWNSTGELLATAGNDGGLQIWNEAGNPLHTTRQEKAKGMTGVAWHPTENKVVMIGESITLHDGTGTFIRQVRHRPDSKGFCLLLCVDWHPSGGFFVIGDYGNHDTGDLPVLQFWSSDLRLLKTIHGVKDAPFRNIRWNRDGSVLATASDGLRLWSKEGEPLHAGKSPDHLWGVCWNPKGDRLLTSSIGGRVTAWTSTAKEIKRVVEVPLNE